MPFVHVCGKLIRFAHVPRTGGSSVENYLAARFGRLAFLDRRHLKVPRDQRWSNTSPQHLEAAALARLVPPEWIAAFFAVVRHPEDRIVSVFRYQRDLERAIPADARFPDWVAGLQAHRASDPHYLDNHPRPAVDLVEEGATVFHLEDGLNRVVTWLDGIEGAARRPRAIGTDNGYRARLAKTGFVPGPPPEVTRDARVVINTLFKADFERFGYAPRGDDQNAGDDRAGENAKRGATP